MEEKESIPTEAECLKMVGDLLRDESLESTRRMVAMCAASEEVGVKTLETLQEQGEQLDNVNSHLDVIQKDLKETGDDLDRMESSRCMFCQCFSFFWNVIAGKQSSGHEERRAEEPCVEKKKKKTVYDIKLMKRIKKPSLETVDPEEEVDEGAKGEPIFETMGGDDREEELEDSISQVSDAMISLKTICLAMSDEIDLHNSTINEIELKRSAVSGDILETTQRAQRLSK